jgi:hypothetical protein
MSPFFKPDPIHFDSTLPVLDQTLGRKALPLKKEEDEATPTLDPNTETTTNTKQAMATYERKRDTQPYLEKLLSNCSAEREKLRSELQNYKQSAATARGRQR